MGFAQGVSGLNAAAANLDVIGNNIANSGTFGFKSGGVQFSDVYAGSKIGLGTKVSGVVQNFTAGSIQTSTRALDLAILNGDGFFRLASAGGEIAYTRNGQFDMDKDGFIVNSSGLRLTGYQVGANGAVAGGSPAPLQLPTASMPPSSTKNITAQFNLNSGSKAPGVPFNASNSETYNYANSVTVYDSLGNSHELTTYFVKDPAPAINSWTVYATADGWPLDGTTGAKVAPDVVDPTKPANGGLSFGQAAFDSNGALAVNAGVIVNPPNGKMDFGTLDFGNDSSPMVYSMDFTGTTQFGSPNDVKKLTQDGYTAGVLSAIAINEDGTITGKYSNEQPRTLGQVVLSSFANPTGLQSKGDNVWAETAVSGQPLTGTPGAGTKLGGLASGALEASNVDLTSELVNLIIAQRTYQANSQTVKTQDQVMQTLINMR
ncbi:flagellar hook protein FlgE [Polaromonas sp. OV174]|uniref:flagellar hook protein FlgE n=1 Tax=Polaromonas sp. OV174 TaxID=1855300 RepID=UPI0008E9726A|nr:flagellar hook protein FlgE [Polaromonas sp. OV174]SFC67977.1 flagellar hook protein FlgE [Polaromonas sp. OV174]